MRYASNEALETVTAVCLAVIACTHRAFVCVDTVRTYSDILDLIAVAIALEARAANVHAQRAAVNVRTASDCELRCCRRWTEHSIMCYVNKDSLSHCVPC